MRGPSTHAIALLVLVLCACAPVVVHAQDDGPNEAAERGLEVLRDRGCAACHSLDGSPLVGPTFVGLWGSERQVLVDGVEQTVVADEAYVLRSIDEPQAAVAVGFPPGMPPIAVPTDERPDLLAALQYLETHSVEGRKALPISLVLLASFLFVAFHLTASSRPIRGHAIEMLGERTFQGLYSLCVLILLAFVIWAFAGAEFVEVWQPPRWTRYLPLVGMPIVMFLFVAAVTTKSPTAAGQTGVLKKEEDAARGILRITRHPMNMAFALWALLHIPANGELASIALFGAILTLAILGTLHIEARRRRDFPETWPAFAAVTSVVPFGAIVRGRQSLGTALKEIGFVRVVVAAAVYATSLTTHALTIGLPAWP